MKVPGEVKKYCPFCNTHTLHKVKLASKGQRRTLAHGELKHKRKLKGHGGKRAGKKDVEKQGKRNKLTLTCQQCNKKHELVVGTRTRKKAEIQR